MKRAAIRWFVAIVGVCIAMDTIPRERFPAPEIQDWLHRQLDRLGLSQGSWPLFAPNPVLNNGILIAEVTDRKGDSATWSSIDWAQADPWVKFVRFRHMNYLQRLPRNAIAAGDFAEYLLRAIPEREKAIASVRWSEENEMLPPAELDAPLREVRLYHYRDSMVLGEGIAGVDAPLPPQSQTVWSTQIGFLARRPREP